VTQTKNMRKLIKKTAVDLMDDNEKVMISDLIASLKEYERTTILENLRWLVDHDEIEMGPLGKSFVIN
jgi:hypothetical protein